MEGRIEDRMDDIRSDEDLEPKEQVGAEMLADVFPSFADIILAGSKCLQLDELDDGADHAVHNHANADGADNDCSVGQNSFQ